MLASVANTRSESTGLRPFDPLRDLRPMVELIELSFGEDLDPQSREMLNEMRALSYVGGPLLWLLSKTSPTLKDLFSGYVWVEEGRVVGNITVHRRYRGKRGWFISNLAVHTDYRRQGIADRLMREGTELARRRHARRISLEVRTGNLAAQKLYKKLGFTKVDSVTKMRLEKIVGVSPVAPREYGIRLVKPEDWRKVHQLAEDAFSWQAKEITPVKEEDYRKGFAQRLLMTIGNVLRGRREYRWAAERDDRFLALLTLRTGGAFYSHSLAMMVDPDHRGMVEEMLLTAALATLNPYPTRPLLATIHPSYQEAVDIFKEYGFISEETLDLLTLGLEGD
jgi:ribosomal protein S18 acetylase RimI-like enzyme